MAPSQVSARMAVMPEAPEVIPSAWIVFGGWAFGGA